jgi:hypothetical protein
VEVVDKKGGGRQVSIQEILSSEVGWLGVY